LAGDDIFVINTAFSEKGMASGVANSVLIRLNQQAFRSFAFAAEN